MTKFLMFAICVLLFINMNVKAAPWQPSATHQQLAIWPAGKMPDAVLNPPPESMQIKKDKLIAGKPITTIFNVSQPTLIIYTPTVKNTGAAIVVFPGGGFNGLAIDLEGTEICEWLAAHGITGILLKYRVPDSGPAWHEDCHCNIHPKAPTALQDAQRTLGLIRSHAAQWHINPHKIGVLGFSSGGYMVAEISTHFKTRVYTPIDTADKESCRPDFAIALYPGHMRKKDIQFVLNPEIVFTHETPNTFLVQAENDPMDDINNSLLYYIGLKNAHVPVEMHLYAEGGHGFGLRQSNLPITEWPFLMETWLKSMKIE